MKGEKKWLDTDSEGTSNDKALLKEESHRLKEKEERK